MFNGNWDIDVVKDFSFLSSPLNYYVFDQMKAVFHIFCFPVRLFGNRNGKVHANKFKEMK